MSGGPYRGIDSSLACAFHPGFPGGESCERCGRRICDECLVWDEARASCRPCRQHPARVARRLARPLGAVAGAVSAVVLSGWFVVSFTARTEGMGREALTQAACDRAVLECVASGCVHFSPEQAMDRVERFFGEQCAATSLDYSNGSTALARHHQFARAGELLDEAVRRFPRDGYAYRARADFVRERLGRLGLERVMADYAAAFDLAPEAFANDVASLVDGEHAACPLFDRTLARWRVPPGRAEGLVTWIAQLESRCHPRPARAGRPLTRHQQRLRLQQLERHPTRH